MQFFISRLIPFSLVPPNSVKNGGDIRECMKVENIYNGVASGDVNSQSEPIEDCQELRTAYYLCKRSGLDMRTRIRGPRVY